jgi:amino acid transporter
VHPRFRTPHVAIVASAAVALAIGLAGSFAAAAALSAIARLVLYAVTCAALVALRRQGDAPPAGFALPAGPLVAVAGIATTGWLLATRSVAQAWGVGAIVLAGLAVWGAARVRKSHPGGA